MSPVSVFQNSDPEALACQLRQDLLDTLHPGTFIGKGKAHEFAEQCQVENVDTIIFDDELTPGQARNLEKIFECKIFYR